MERWQALAEELDIDEFIIRDNEKRPSAKVIAEVAHSVILRKLLLDKPPKADGKKSQRGLS